MNENALILLQRSIERLSLKEIHFLFLDCALFDLVEFIMRGYVDILGRKAIDDILQLTLHLFVFYRIKLLLLLIVLFGGVTALCHGLVDRGWNSSCSKVLLKLIGVRSFAYGGRLERAAVLIGRCLLEGGVERTGCFSAIDHTEQ